MVHNPPNWYRGDDALLEELKTAALDEVSRHDPMPGDWPQWRGPRRDGTSSSSMRRADDSSWSKQRRWAITGRRSAPFSNRNAGPCPRWRTAGSMCAPRPRSSASRSRADRGDTHDFHVPCRSDPRGKSQGSRSSLCRSARLGAADCAGGGGAGSGPRRHAPGTAWGALEPGRAHVRHLRSLWRCHHRRRRVG